MKRITRLFSIFVVSLWMHTGAAFATPATALSADLSVAESVADMSETTSSYGCQWRYQYVWVCDGYGCRYAYKWAQVCSLY
jgi:hypothetical protein